MVGSDWYPYPQKFFIFQAVYIAPLKALVRERIEDWKVRFEQQLKKRYVCTSKLLSAFKITLGGIHDYFSLSVVELTGDVTPDMRAISKADVIVTTPEKWDGISRSWQTRNYVQDVALLVIDEIHLLGDERGPVLEVIVSRTNFISSHTEQGVRVVGLSTALANARDLADWLGIKQVIWWWKYSLNFHNHVISNLYFRLDYSTSVHPYVPCLCRFISTAFLANIIVRAWQL